VAKDEVIPLVVIARVPKLGGELEASGERLGSQEGVEDDQCAAVFALYICPIC